jgi:hypothetical protein
LNFGDIVAGNVSLNISENVTNLGNRPINVSVYGYGRIPGDNNSFTCNSSNITIDALRFAGNITASYNEKQNLSGAPKQIGITVDQQTTPSITTNATYWQVQIPNGPETGQCNGTIIFQAELS